MSEDPNARGFFPTQKTSMLTFKAEIKSNAQEFFKKLRIDSNIREDEILSSLDPVNNKGTIFQASERINVGYTGNEGGASNSFFFFTDDMKFLVKTISGSELKLLLKILPGMKNHFQKMSEASTPSMISQI